MSSSLAPVRIAVRSIARRPRVMRSSFAIQFATCASRQRHNSRPSSNVYASVMSKLRARRDGLWYGDMANLAVRCAAGPHYFHKIVTGRCSPI